MTEAQPLNYAVSSPRNRPKSKAQTLAKIDYRGITLKEYFRRVDESIDHSTIEQIKQEPIQSESSSVVQTPNFGSKPTYPKKRQYENRSKKLKTEANENVENEEDENLEMYYHQNKNHLNISFEQVPTINHLCKKLNGKNKSKNISSIEKLNTSLMRKISVAKKPTKKNPQKVKTLGIEETDRSTLSGFYRPSGKNISSNNHIEKKNRMLKKIQADRERSQEIKQQDIFYITKYANKFKIDPKQLTD